MVTLVLMTLVYIITMIISVIIYNKYRKRMERSILEKNETIDLLLKNIEVITFQKDDLSKRVIELENGVETGFGIKVRTIKVETIVNFTKLELICMIAGIEKLLKSQNVHKEDMQFYLDLINKIDKTVSELEG